MTGFRILVVEDDNVLVHHLKICLKSMGHTVVGVCSYGEDAVEKARGLMPDLILMDIMLRGAMSGIEAMHRIHSHLDIPVVYLTASEDDKTLQSTKITSTFGYLLKPFRAVELKNIIEIALYRHQMERALKERHGFIESILSHIQSGIIVTDLEFNILLMNPYAEKHLDISGESVIGKGFETICPTFAEALTAERSSDEIYCNVCAREHVIGFKMVDMMGKDGSVNGHIVSFTDLTEIVKIRKEMKLNERLANLGEFVARVAHEIRNPLFGITAICQIFSMELPLNEEHKKLLDIMMQEALRLKHNVDELLDCSRELKIIKKRCDLVKVIDDTLIENDLFISEHNVAIEKNIADDDYTLEADQDKIKQVVINLLKNAVEASGNKGVIRIFAQKSADHIRLSISDSGTGIPENIIDKIFDVFYTTKRHGTGLGLPISKNIIEAHNGTLTAQNIPTGGAQFTICIPVNGVEQ